MKIRTGFVSNSSSSSFVIDRDNITNVQVACIINHQVIAGTLGMDYPEDHDYDWQVEVTPATITGYTSMDNFPMHEFLAKIGVAEENIKWGYNG